MATLTRIQTMTTRIDSLLLLATLLATLLVVGCTGKNDVEAARELQAAGRFEESLEPVRRGLESSPDDSELHYMNGLALVRTGRFTQAVWSLSKAMEDSEWLVPAGLLKASVGLTTNNHELALEAVDRILAEHPDDSDALVLRARTRIDMRSDYEGALEDADRVLEIDPSRRDAKVVRTVALLGLNRADEAEAALDELELKADDPMIDADTSGQLCAVRAVFLKEKGEIEKADELFTGCLEEFPVHPLVLDSALEFFDETSQPERSIEVVRAALVENPQLFGYRVALSQRLLSAGRRDEAESLLREALDIEAIDPASVWSALAGLHLSVGDYESMASDLEEALELSDAPDQDLLFSLADAYVLSGRHDEALATAQRLSVPAYRHIINGRVYLKQGKPAAALEELEAGLLLWPNHAVARYYAAIAAEELGDFDRAIEEYRYSIRTDAAATDARHRLALLHVAEGKDELAIEVVMSTSRMATDYEASLVALRAAVRSGQPTAMRAVQSGLREDPSMHTRLVAAIAAGTRDRAGPAAAATFLITAEGVDLSAPASSGLLRDLLVYSRGTDIAPRADELIASVLAARPGDADVHEIEALRLSLAGAPKSEVRGQYEQALELDPGHVDALLGLAQLEREAGDDDAAMALLDRAVEADPEGAQPRRAKVDLLLALGREAQAETELEALLEEHPVDGAAAAQLAELRRTRGVDDERTAELERRAARFVGAGESAE
jgi:tetratricopeptide (TPR) repeat protein